MHSPTSPGGDTLEAEKVVLGALMYPGFEMLDMFGPLEMFSVLGPDKVEIQMIAAEDGAVPTALGQALEAGPRVVPDCSFDDTSGLDILLVPGGFGTMPQLENQAVLEFLQQQAETARFICSVCTGSLLLARAGLLDHRRATTNKQFFALTAMVPSATRWVEQARWVEDGKFFTSSGVSAGMDMALALIAQLWDTDTAEAAAASAEYSWHRDADSDPFHAHLNQGARAMGLV